MPSFEWSLASVFPSSKFLAVGVNASASTVWLVNYRNMRGLTYPFIYDQAGQIFSLYEVGGTYGNNPPSYVLIDMTGIVRFRTDDRFNQTDSIAAIVSRLIGN